MLTNLNLKVKKIKKTNNINKQIDNKIFSLGYQVVGRQSCPRCIIKQMKKITALGHAV